MPITLSQIVEDVRQADGRRWMRERHTDQLGIVLEFRYLADALANVSSIMAARVPRLNAQLTQNEISINLNEVTTLGRTATPTFNYSTVAQNVAALRTFYSSATQIQAIMTGDYLSSLTDAQLQSAFGLTAAQVTTLRTNKLTPAATLADQIRAATGQ